MANSGSSKISTFDIFNKYEKGNNVFAEKKHSFRSERSALSPQVETVISFSCYITLQTVNISESISRKLITLYSYTNTEISGYC